MNTHRCRQNSRAMRGSMDTSTPALMLAIIGGLLINHWWDALPSWAVWLGVPVIGLFAAYGLLTLGSPTGMAANLERTRKERDEES